MEVDVDVVGIGSLEKDLRKMYKSLNRKDLLKLMRPSANRLVKAIKAEAPVRKGYLRNAIKLVAWRGKNDAPSATLVTTMAKTYPYKGKQVKPYYAWFVHNGTVTSAGKRKHRKGAAVGAQRIKPNPFVERAYDAQIDDVGVRILEAIEKKVTL